MTFAEVGLCVGEIIFGLGDDLTVMDFGYNGACHAVIDV